MQYYQVMALTIPWPKLLFQVSWPVHQWPWFQPRSPDLPYFRNSAPLCILLRTIHYMSYIHIFIYIYKDIWVLKTVIRWYHLNSTRRWIQVFYSSECPTEGKDPDNSLTISRLYINNISSYFIFLYNYIPIFLYTLLILYCKRQRGENRRHPNFT